MGSKQRVRQSLHIVRSHTSSNTKDQGAAVLTAIAQDSFSVEKKLGRVMGFRLTEQVCNEADNLNAECVLQKLKKTISEQPPQNIGADSTVIRLEVKLTARSM